MKSYNIEQTGEVPAIIMQTISWAQGKPATKDNFNRLDSDISFIVVDCGLAHGNTTKCDKTAWLSPKNNDGSWNVRIQVK